MTGDPCEVMSKVVAQEASYLQARSDDQLLVDALAIAEAEQQRTRMSDRLEAARGLVIGAHLPAGVFRGRVLAVGSGILVLDSSEACMAIATSSIISVEGLPYALRAESEAVRRLQTTWSSILRDWLEVAPVRFTLADGRCVQAFVDSVGEDFVDVRVDGGKTLSLVISRIQLAIRAH